MFATHYMLIFLNQYIIYFVFCILLAIFPYMFVYTGYNRQQVPISFCGPFSHTSKYQAGQAQGRLGRRHRVIFDIMGGYSDIFEIQILKSCYTSPAIMC